MCLCLSDFPFGFGWQSILWQKFRMRLSNRGQKAFINHMPRIQKNAPAAAVASMWTPRNGRSLDSGAVLKSNFNPSLLPYVIRLYSYASLEYGD
ncbi:hypothetical protein ACLOJK_030080 [Asimina triloba]